MAMFRASRVPITTLALAEIQRRESATLGSPRSSEGMITRTESILPTLVISLAGTLTLFLSAIASAQPSFTVLPALPGSETSECFIWDIHAISGDGGTVIGRCDTAGPIEEFRWTAATGTVQIDPTVVGMDPRGVSFDGSEIVGSGALGSTVTTEFRWRLGLGTFALTAFSVNPNAVRDVSGDGVFAVGWNGGQAVRWSDTGGLEGLGFIPGCAQSVASAVSHDGSVVAGHGLACGSPFPAHGLALRWSQADGIQPLGVIPGLNHGRSLAFAVSADGSAIVGVSSPESGFSGRRAFLWTAADGMINLGLAPGDSSSINYGAHDVAQQGCTVVGNTSSSGGAFIWDPVHGMRHLGNVLTGDFGLDLSGILSQGSLTATGISDDGTVITGTAHAIVGAHARQRAYVAVIENPACAVDTVPVADAGEDQVVDEGDLVALDGTGSSDPQGDPLGYDWVQVAGAPVTLSDPTAAQPSFTAPFVSANTTLTFELVVDDGTNFSDPDTVDVTVVNVNSPPVADAGDDSTIKEGAVATLDGGNSFDPEGDTPLFYTWNQTEGPPVTLQPSDSVASPTFTAPLGVGTLLTFELSVDDGKEVGAPDSVTVEVVENSTPVADAGADQTVGEGTSVALDGSGSSDPDGGDTLSYQWTQVAGTPVTLAGATSAAPTFDAPSVPAGGEDLVFELVVTDDDPVNPKSSVPDSVTVSVLNVNDPPQCDLAQSACPASKLDDRDGCLLWPPNHKMVSVGIVGVTDPDADGVTIEITGVTQDEPVNGQGDGDSSPDAVIQAGAPADSVLLRAERTGLGGAQENGRVYAVSFSADDGIDSCSGSVTVGVPHDRKDTPVDDGQLFDSTQP